MKNLMATLIFSFSLLASADNMGRTYECEIYAGPNKGQSFMLYQKNSNDLANFALYNPVDNTTYIVGGQNNTIAKDWTYAFKSEESTTQVYMITKSPKQISRVGTIFNRSFRAQIITISDALGFISFHTKCKLDR